MSWLLLVRRWLRERRPPAPSLDAFELTTLDRLRQVTDKQAELRLELIKVEAKVDGYLDRVRTLNRMLDDHAPDAPVPPV